MSSSSLTGAFFLLWRFSRLKPPNGKPGEPGSCISCDPVTRRQRRAWDRCAAKPGEPGSKSAFATRVPTLPIQGEGAGRF